MTITNTDQDLILMSHLMRRAGFGATRNELEDRLKVGYEATVDALLDTSKGNGVDYYEFIRYFPMWWKPGTMGGLGQASWVWTMINSQSPLTEKLCIFYHNIFATGVSKVDHYDEIEDMIDIFREKGLGHYKEILLEMAKSPAMIYWLDNHENHFDSVNENWGRELLELFTMGVGNYTEDDVRECSKAFTGWTLEHKLPRFHMGRWDLTFKFDSSDHVFSEKTFLGHTGKFDGEDIIDIILSKPATANFIARHIYSFFVADEPQVPAWSVIPPANPDAVDFIAQTLMDSDYHMETVLRSVFNSDFFKNSQYSRVKNPTEVVVSTLRLVKNYHLASPEILDWSSQITNMGQDLMNPPSVEGWHSGIEWINSGTLMKRTNFMADLIGNKQFDGVKEILHFVKSQSNTPESVVESCLNILGPLVVSNDTRQELIDHVSLSGNFDWNDDTHNGGDSRTLELLQLIVATREYQFC